MTRKITQRWNDWTAQIHVGRGVIAQTGNVTENGMVASSRNDIQTGLDRCVTAPCQHRRTRTNRCRRQSVADISYERPLTVQVSAQSTRVHPC